MYPADTDIPDEGLVKIPYQTTLIEMFQDISSGVKASSYSQAEIIYFYGNASQIIEEDCNQCIKMYKKKCKCKNLKKVSKKIRYTQTQLEKKLGKRQKFKSFAISSTKRTIKALKKLPNNFVAFVEETSSIFNNVTKCTRKKNLAFLITGGEPSFNESFESYETEIYNPSTNAGCRLPQLPETRSTHTQNYNLICGGFGGTDFRQNCLKWDSKFGIWTQSHTLKITRRFHFSWVTSSGVYLLGGEQSSTTNLTDAVEVLTENEVTVSDLKKVHD